MFEKNRYEVSISEYHANGGIVTTVSANDQDSATSDTTASGILRYQINASNPVSNQAVFTISQTTGEIYLARTLTNDQTANIYTVSFN